MAELTSLVIYDSRIFAVGGHVNRWANSVERRFVMNAKQEAPSRSGELRAGISGESFKVGPKHWEIHIHSDAEHTMYVLRGTQGPIMSDAAWAAGGVMPDRGQREGHFLNLRPGNGYGYLIRHKVRGQRANNFFGRAADATARRHSSLRGFDPGFNY